MVCIFLDLSNCESDEKIKFLQHAISVMLWILLCDNHILPFVGPGNSSTRTRRNLRSKKRSCSHAKGPQGYDIGAFRGQQADRGAHNVQGKEFTPCCFWVISLTEEEAVV